MIFVVRATNSEVTDYYLNIVAKMFQMTGEKLYTEGQDFKKCKRDDVIIVTTLQDLIKVYVHGFRNIVYWMQGIDAEESYMKNGSIIRKAILEYMTRFAMSKAKVIFYVSKAMQDYVETKYKINTGDKSFVMPCFNVSLEDGLVFDENKYNKNVFAYVGSLSKWQCFSETIDFYCKIEEQYSNTELRVFTFSRDEAESILIEKKVKNYSVSTVPPAKMSEALKEVKFGFVLREDNPVNNVATPTKISSYLSAGVIPIFSSCITDFYERTKGFSYVVPMENNTTIPTSLKKLMEDKVDFDCLQSEYMSLFETYYNPQYYIESYRTRIGELRR